MQNIIHLNHLKEKLEQLSLLPQLNIEQQNLVNFYSSPEISPRQHKPTKLSLLNQLLTKLMPPTPAVTNPFGILADQESEEDSFENMDINQQIEHSPDATSTPHSFSHNKSPKPPSQPHSNVS
jgi:hypothetical protein